MRDYLQLSNLSRATRLGGIITLMSIPRLVQGNAPHWLYVFAAFLCLTLVAGAATAWGETGGMAGLFPRDRRLGVGLVFAVLAGILVGIIHSVALDPLLQEALVDSGNTDRLLLQFPNTIGKQVAIILWVAGFQALFFNAAAMSFLCRLTRRITIALPLAIAFRVFVSHLQLESLHLGAIVPYYAMNGISCAVGCMLFARAGLIPASLFAAILASRHVFQG